MAKRSIEMTRRRLLGGILTIGGASAATGAGTMSYFSDTEPSTGNSISAGTLDLTLDGGQTTVQFLSETSIAPGDSGRATIAIANAGSLPGYIDVEVASLTSYENGLSGNENSVDGSGGDPGAGNGELQDYLEVHAEFQNGPALWSGFDTVENRLGTGTPYDRDYQLAAGASDTFVVDWQLPPSVGDDAQSDGIEFALTFSLDQQADTGV